MKTVYVYVYLSIFIIISIFSCFSFALLALPMALLLQYDSSATKIIVKAEVHRKDVEKVMKINKYELENLSHGVSKGLWEITDIVHDPKRHS